MLTLQLLVGADVPAAQKRLFLTRHRSNFLQPALKLAVLPVVLFVVFLQLTILLPCWDCFVTESLKDRLPQEQWESPAVKRAGLRMSLTWAAMLSLCAFVTLVS